MRLYRLLASLDTRLIADPAQRANAYVPFLGVVNVLRKSSQHSSACVNQCLLLTVPGVGDLRMWHFDAILVQTFRYSLQRSSRATALLGAGISDGENLTREDIQHLWLQVDHESR